MYTRKVKERSYSQTISRFQTGQKQTESISCTMYIYTLGIFDFGYLEQVYVIAYTGEVLLVVDGGITDTPALTQVVEALRLSQLQLLCIQETIVLTTERYSTCT